MCSFEEAVASLASREAANLADPDISGRHSTEKRDARKLILAKMIQYSAEYKNLPVLKKHGGLTDDGARAVRRRLVALLREAPLTHGFKASAIFLDKHEIGDRMKNCWHLNAGGGMRERTEEALFQYSKSHSSTLIKKYSSGGTKSDTFNPTTRPFYAALNYSNAKYGGSSAYGKTHLVMKHVLRFNATFTYIDSFGVMSSHKTESRSKLANYHNMYSIILNVKRGEKDSTGGTDVDVLKSMIDHSLGRKPAPDEEFGGSHYVEAQIPGDIVYSRDIEKLVIATSEVDLSSTTGKNVKKFCKKNNIRIELA